MKYAVTGSTGHFGQQAVPYLDKISGADDTVIALARNTEKANQLFSEDVEVRPGSYENVDELTESLKSVDRLLFISSQPGAKMPRIQQHKNVIQAAKNAGVQFIAYTSFPHADTTAAPLAADHQATEKAIEASGIAHAFLRNNWYLENELGTLTAAKNGEPFVYAAGDGQVGWQSEKYYAQAAATVLTLAQPKTVYEFSGPLHTYAELAEAVKQATGSSFEVNDVSEEDYKAGLKNAKLPEPVIDMVMMIQKLIKHGDLSEANDDHDLEDVLGKTLPTLEEEVQSLLSV